jgi:hypothetical protein
LKSKIFSQDHKHAAPLDAVKVVAEFGIRVKGIAITAAPVLLIETEKHIQHRQNGDDMAYISEARVAFHMLHRIRQLFSALKSLQAVKTVNK